MNSTSTQLALVSLLVGMHFRPPAKLLLASLPSGTELSLRREPENPYDEQAIACYLDTSSIPASQHGVLAEALPGAGFELEEVLAGGPWHLGYVAASDGKPLRGTPYVGNREFGSAMTEGGVARLSFDPEGKPLLTLLSQAELEISFDPFV